MLVNRQHNIGLFNKTQEKLAPMPAWSFVPVCENISTGSEDYIRRKGRLRC